MLKFLLFALPVLYALLMWRFSERALRRELDARARPLDDATLEAATRRLGRAVDIPHLRAHVLPEETFNGLASPDGRIFITEGVLKRYRRGKVTADEVASIVAHELGHVALGHSKRRMTEMAAQNAARTIFAMLLFRFIPFVGGYIAAWLASLLGGLVAAGLSRRDEYEADAYAAALMRKAGLDGEAQTALLEKLGREAPTPGGAVAWLMSHPATEKRVAAVRQLQEQWDGPPA